MSDDSDSDTEGELSYEEVWESRTSPGYQLLKNLFPNKITHAHMATLVRDFDHDHYLSKVKVFKGDKDVEILYPNEQGLWKIRTNTDPILLGIADERVKIEEFVEGLRKVGSTGEKAKEVKRLIDTLEKAVNKLELNKTVEA